MKSGTQNGFPLRPLRGNVFHVPLLVTCLRIPWGNFAMASGAVISGVTAATFLQYPSAWDNIAGGGLNVKPLFVYN